MDEFQHLILKTRVKGTYRAKAVPRSPILDSRTQRNINNRASHGASLLSTVSTIRTNWERIVATRAENNLPNLPDPDVTSFFIEIDTEKFNIESLKSFGIEIIAEEQSGLIIGASSVEFISLEAKINAFLLEEKDQAAQLWSIAEGSPWKTQRILSPALFEKWSAISDNEMLTVDVGIACYIKAPDYPERTEDEEDNHFETRVGKWQTRKDAADQERSDREFERQNALDELVAQYGGQRIDSFIDYGDSFMCRLLLSGKALRDLVINYQYVFEVVEYDPLTIQNTDGEELEAIEVDILAPEKNAPRVCIIDSGIQEQHKLLSPAIDTTSSTSFIPGDTSVADAATRTGGHGTRVAGAVLYPYDIPKSGTYQLPCFIQNARVMINTPDGVQLPRLLPPPQLMKQVVDQFEETRVFNMSINTFSNYNPKHMSPWAAQIDQLMFNKDILFIVSAGNLLPSYIHEHLTAGNNYPNFLLEEKSKIADPAQSSFALTVGSVCIDEFDNGTVSSFGKRDHPSSFSRTGLGLWGMVKPDVVEYGGDLTTNKATSPLLAEEKAISPELVRATLGSGPATGRDMVGTSFAAPKVSYIVAKILQYYPNESVNLYRALVAQSARMPGDFFLNPTLESLRHYGYGIPNLERAITNTPNRVTLITSNKLIANQADTYSIKIPTEFRAPGEDFEILIEVTLAYMAPTRRTRLRTNSYLETWLRWETSKIDESYEDFETRIIKDLEEEESATDTSQTIKWNIRENKSWGVGGVKRQDSTLQKSWCVMKGHDLPESLNLAIIARKGWATTSGEKVPYSIAVSFEVISGNLNVYELIRNEIEVEINQEIQIETE